MLRLAWSLVALFALVRAQDSADSARLAQYRNLGKAFYENPTTQKQAGFHLRDPHFRNVTAAMVAAFNRPIVGRGAAYADFDRVGDLDVLIFTNDGPACLLSQSWGQSQSMADHPALAATFGLGKDTTASVEIEWPSGTKQSIGSVAANQFLTTDESRRVVARPAAARQP